jgi:hypothetical protein
VVNNFEKEKEEMKAILTILALTIASATVMASNQPADSLKTYEEQIGFQRRLILEHKAALDQAYASRNNQVHISKDLLDVLAYGVSTGYLSYDFMKATGNMQRVRDVLTLRKAPKELIPTTEEPIASPAERVAASTSRDVAVSAPGRVMARNIGRAAFRTTELASAAILGVYLVGDVYNTGKDLVIRFSDTDEIKEHRAKLNEAEQNLAVADQNLQVAVKAEMNQQ